MRNEEEIIISRICTALCLGMSTTAFAANSPSVNNSGSQSTVTNPSPSVNNSGSQSTVTNPSPSEDNTSSSDSSSNGAVTTIIDGKTINLIVMSVEEADLTDKQEEKIGDVLDVLKSGNSSKILDMQKDLVKSVTGKNITSVGYSKLVDVTIPEDLLTIPDGGLVVSFPDKNVKPGMNIVVLHLKADGTWESVPVTLGVGAIHAKFTSLSPVYIMEVTYETTSAGTTNTTTNNTTTNNTAATTTTDSTSPKTGETNMNMFVVLLAVAALGGAVVFGTRKAKYIK